MLIQQEWGNEILKSREFGRPCIFWQPRSSIDLNPRPRKFLLMQHTWISQLLKSSKFGTMHRFQWPKLPLVSYLRRRWIPLRQLVHRRQCLRSSKFSRIYRFRCLGSTLNLYLRWQWIPLMQGAWQIGMVKLNDMWWEMHDSTTRWRQSWDQQWRFIPLRKYAGKIKGWYDKGKRSNN